MKSSSYARKLPLAFLIALSSACTTTDIRREAAYVQDILPGLCELSSRAEIATGKIIRFRATYSTDMQSYSFFRDLDGDCGVNGVLREFDVDGEAKTEWEALLAHRSAVCKARRAEAFCAYSAVVNATVEVVSYENENYARVRSIKVVDAAADE